MATIAAASLSLAAGAAQAASPDADRAAVAALDIAYQAAVKANDAAAMAAILHPQMTLVIGTGGVVSREDLLTAARERTAVYEIQDEAPGSQTVRLFGDTAVVTAKLRLKYVTGGKPFDRTLWFSDTYVRTADGWRYAFGQASMALPQA
jgi:ketosteroid isomerase-like protein